MEISGAMGTAAQEMATNKVSSGFDALTKTLQKTEQNEPSEQQRSEIAEHTGKGMNIDIKA